VRLQLLAVVLVLVGCGSGGGEGVPSGSVDTPASITDDAAVGASGSLEGGDGGDPDSGSTRSGSTSGGDGSTSAANCPFPISASDHAGRVAALGAQLDALVAKFERDHDSGGAGTIDCPAAGSSATDATANWGTYAFAKLARGTDAAGTAMALSALSCMFKYQDNSASSSTYGVFRFHVDNAPLASDNSTEFALEPVAWLLSRNFVPAATVTKLAPQIVAGLDAIDDHEVCPDYTNICLVQQAIRLAIGGAFVASSNATLAADGKTRIAKAKSELDAWAATVKTGGIREYDSPTYGEIDFEALLLAHQGALTAGDTTARARVDGAIDYLWSDFAANTFSSRGTLSPPYGRTYDFAGGQGVLAYGLWLEGLIDGPPCETATASMAAWLYSGEPTAHRPPANALCLSTPATREVVSEWQQDGQKTFGRYAYLTPDYTLGSSTADLPTSSNIDIDLLVAGSLVSTPTTPMLAVIPDWLDAPLAPIATGNFTKVTHLPLDPAVVQKDGALLLLERVPAADPGYGTPLVNLTTNLVLPAKVDGILLDGAMLDPTKTGKASARPVVVAQNESGVMGMAVIDASALDCVTSAGAIEASGTEHVDVLPLAVDQEDPAVRLAIRHLDTPPGDTSTLKNCFARVALLMVGRHCDGAGCGAALSADLTAAVAAATSSFSTTTGAWSVEVQVPGGPTLKASRGTATAGDISVLQAAGVTPSFGPLRINGTAIPLVP
jgi:hypothetical protein